MNTGATLQERTVVIQPRGCQPRAYLGARLELSDAMGVELRPVLAHEVNGCRHVLLGEDSDLARVKPWRQSRVAMTEDSHMGWQGMKITKVRNPAMTRKSIGDQGKEVAR